MASTALTLPRNGLLHSRALPPSRVLVAGTLFALLLSLACVLLAHRQPFLGFGYTAHIAGRSVVQHLPVASEGIDIAADHGQRMTLQQTDLVIEPDIAFHDYDSFNQFLQRQKQLANIIRSPRVQVIDRKGNDYVSPPLHRRPLLSLPVLFWYQLLVGMGCWLCGLAIWAFRRDEQAAVYCALSSLGILLLTDSAAVYSTRELALPGSTFHALSTLNHFGSMLACGAFIAVLWYYPKRLGKLNLGPWLVSGYLLVWLADVNQVLPLGNYGFHVTTLLAFIATFSLAAWQWRVTRREPLERAALQWFLLSWCTGSGIYLILVTLPVVVGFNSGHMEPYAFGALFLIALGLGLGVARYRLFELETWWFRALAFLLGGFSVVALDVLLTSVLAFDSPTSLALALGLSGWVYFPVRQWLAARLFASARRMRAGDVPALLREVLSTSALNTQSLLPEALRRLYAPLALTPLSQPQEVVAIVDNGLSLHVPGIDQSPGWAVRWADRGNRLFNHDDVEVATTVRAVLERIAAYRHAVDQGVEQERVRLTRDLHDDVGARLLTLLHRHSEAVGDEVREVLASLRQTVHGLSAPPLSLAQAADAWQAEAAERCQLAGIALNWQQPETLPAHSFSPVEQVDLGRILREAISNTLRHASPECITIQLHCTTAALQVAIENDGVKPPAANAAPAQARAGLGMRTMHSRIQRLGGSLQFECSPPLARLSWHLPLKPSPPSIQGVPPAHDTAAH